MKRSFLASLGLDKAIIDLIMEEYGSAIQSLKDRNAETQDWKAKFEAEAAAHKATIDSVNAEKDAADTIAKISALLKNAGMRDLVIPKALKLFDKSLVTKNPDGSLAEPDRILDHFRTEWSEFFGKTATAGSDVGQPPAPAASPAANKFMFNFQTVRPSSISQ